MFPTFKTLAQGRRRMDPGDTESIWHAPQSISELPQPRDAKAHPRSDVYFRRITRPDLPDGRLPSRFQRWTQIVAGTASLGIAVYCALFADWGQREHCFSPLRRLVGVENSSADSPQNTSPFNLYRMSGQDEAWAREKLRDPEDFAKKDPVSVRPRQRGMAEIEEQQRQQQQQQQQSQVAGSGAQAPVIAADAGLRMV